MSKHRKTRKQKIIASYRHNVYTLESKNIISPNATVSPDATAESSYSYVMRDVSKTGLLTISLIAIELILFFLLKNHMIKLPNLSY